MSYMKESPMPVGAITGTTPSTKVATDPRDLNQDGKVSEAEIQAYARTHPSPTTAAAQASAAPEAVPGSATPGSEHLLDITV
jgi:hypothetical protein